MPYDAFSENGRYCVYKLSSEKEPSGASLGCYDTKEQAVEQLRALYAADEKAFAPDILKQVAYAIPSFPIWEQIKLIFKGHKPGVLIYKVDGARYMFIVTSNSYRDREHEYITTDALKNYVERSWIGDDLCKTDNVLLFWHDDPEVPLPPIGDIVWTDMEGPFLIEVARERQTKWAKRVWDYMEANPDMQWGASHGFRYEEKRLSEDGTATYSHIEKFETSVLPLKFAANPYTFSGVIKMQERDELLKKMNIPIEALRKGVAALNKELARQGMEHKGLNGDAIAKGIVETLSTAIDGFVGKLTDVPVPGLKEELMASIVSALAAVPISDAPALENPMQQTPEMTTEETDDMDDMEQPVDENVHECEEGEEGCEENEKGFRRRRRTVRRDFTEKQLKLLDTLTEASATIAEQQIAIADATKALSTKLEALKVLDELPGAVKAFDDRIKAFDERIKAVEKQLSGRPRQASHDPATVTSTDEVSTEVKEQMKTHSSFWGVGVNALPKGK